jgi:hypothetical protein
MGRSMTATNHAGWAVFALDNRMGWRRATIVFDEPCDAVARLAGYPKDDVERQVREVIKHKGKIA